MGGGGGGGGQYYRWRGIVPPIIWTANLIESIDQAPSNSTCMNAIIAVLSNADMLNLMTEGLIFLLLLLIIPAPPPQ